jgi:hypothetical protein
MEDIGTLRDVQANVSGLSVQVHEHHHVVILSLLPNFVFNTGEIDLTSNRSISAGILRIFDFQPLALVSSRFTSG